MSLSGLCHGEAGVDMGLYALTDISAEARHDLADQGGLGSYGPVPQG